MAINCDKNKERPVVDSQKTGEFLAALRKAAGYTQQEVADYLNITNKTISKWESGAGLPEIGILPAVAELYGVTVDELLAGKRLEYIPEKEAEGLRQTEKAEARKRWLENSMQEQFRSGQAILWGTMLAGYVILVGVYMGFRAAGISAQWIGAVWCCVWLLAEMVGVYLFWNRYRGGLKTWVEETQDEAPQKKEMFPMMLHHRRMQLLLPFVLAVSAILPLVWIEPFVIPSNIPAMAGGGEFIATAKQLFTEVTYIKTSMMSSAGWDLAIGSLFITLERLIKALPITLLAGCVIWGGIDLLGRLCLKYQPQQTKQLLRALSLSALIFFAVLTAVGEAVQVVQVVTYVKYSSEEEFEREVNTYLLVYNSYRESDKHDGPALEYGVERIDNLYMDYALLGNDHYEKYRGIFAIDYDHWKTYHIGSWNERLEAKNVSLLICSAASAAGMVVFWKKYATASARENKENDID